MNSQQLFYIVITVGLALVAYFIIGRPKPKLPTRLNLRAQSAPVEVQKQIPSDLPPGVLEPEAPTRNSKQLSVFFMYNGHDWEAHEVLGIPQGASIDIATKAYQQLLKTSDPSSYEYLEAAFNAIFKIRRNQKL